MIKIISIEKLLKIEISKIIFIYQDLIKVIKKDLLPTVCKR